MLEVRELCAGYDGSQVLQGLHCQIPTGRIVALVGRNGSGRSTLARALMGLIPSQGQVLWHGQDLQDCPTHERSRRGLAYVPATRDVFDALTTDDNLRLGEGPGRGAPAGHVQRALPPERQWSRERVYDTFPLLAARAGTRAGLLSGGEQQILAVARALMGQPDLLILDEPNEGLAPALVDLLGACLQSLTAQGLSVLLLEHSHGPGLAWADEVLHLHRGRLEPAEIQTRTAG